MMTSSPYFARRQPAERPPSPLPITTTSHSVEEGAAAVNERAPVRLEAARQRLRDRLDTLAATPDLDPGRLEAEAVLLADKLDVTEETVRLRSHLDQFREALAADGPVGRRLNFLAQEIGREVNTIGSKANDAEITRLAVSMKEEVEKIFSVLDPEHPPPAAGDAGAPV